MHRIKYLLPVAALLVGAYLLPAANAAELIPKAPQATEGCAPGNLLCRHLHTVFNLHTKRGRSRMARWDEPIRYTTDGLSPDGEQLFDDLIQGIAARIGLEVRRLPLEESRYANLGLVVAENLDGMLESRKFVRLAQHEHITPEMRAETAARFKETGATLIRLAPSRDHSFAITLCFASVHPKALEQHGALRMASVIYRCLVGFNGSSNEIRPSLLNSMAPLALDSPPYAKMAGVDRAILQAMYEKEFHPRTAAEAADEIETKLRTEGFGDDGVKH